MINLITGIKNGRIVDEEIFNDGLKYFEGKRVVLTCRDYEEKRSLDQNDALWRWNEMLAKETGNTPNDQHYIMLKAIYGVKIIKVYNPKKPEELLDKFEVPRKTTKDLKTKEFSDYITQYFIKAQELFNYTLPPFGWDS